MLDLNITLQELVDNKIAGDYMAVFRREIEKRLREFNPHFVGVSALFNSSSRYIQDIVKSCKDFDPDIITLAGGGLPSAAYKLVGLQSVLQLQCDLQGRGRAAAARIAGCRRRLGRSCVPTGRGLPGTRSGPQNIPDMRSSRTSMRFRR